jgi:hypothetical protein
MGLSSSRPRARIKARTDFRSERLIRTLVAGCGSSSLVLELYYWSREPGMSDIVRGIVAMPEGTRAALEAFLALARDPKSIEASINPQGVLTLTSPEASKTIALARYVTENDGDDTATTLN